MLNVQLESVEERQKTALEKWQNFEDQLEAHTKWFRFIEAIFRDQQLQPTLKDKEERLRACKEERETIIRQEREIDEFVDKSHSLLHSSGVERIKPLISQVSNRYVQLFLKKVDILKFISYSYINKILKFLDISCCLCSVKK